MNMLSSLLIFSGYAYYIYMDYIQQGAEVNYDLVYWAKALLMFIPIAIVFKIISIILFVIGYSIVTGKEQKLNSDERDKLIELRALKNSHWLFILGFFLSLGLLVLGMPPAAMFISIAISGVLSEMVESLVQIHYYRRGF